MLSGLFFICFLVVLCSLGGLGLGVFFKRKIPHLTSNLDYPLPASPPLVSVLIPARNEEKNIETNLRSLLSSNYPNFEVFVYDDRSTDRTHEIVKKLADQNPRLHLIIGREDPPPGWVGKQHALTRLIEAAQPKGEFWLFSDADALQHNPDGLRRVVSYALGQQWDCLSIQPTTKAETFWERVILGPLILSFCITNNPYLSNRNPKPEAAVGYGFFMLVRSSAYRRIGGHAAVKDSLLEDRHLPRLFRKKGFKTGIVFGPEVFSLRMYDSARGIIDAFTRYYYLTFDHSYLKAMAYICGLLLIGWIPLLTLILCLFSAGVGIKIFGILQYVGANVALAYAQNIYFGYLRYVLLMPLGAAITAYIIARSFFRFGRGKSVSWKGRKHQALAWNGAVQAVPVRVLGSSKENN